MADPVIMNSVQPQGNGSAASLQVLTGQALIDFILHLADNALILGHRASEWTGHGPILEQDIALSNIALDLIGQSRNFYQYAAALMNRQDSSATDGRLITEDSLAYLRDVRSFKNCLISELPNGDWGKTILKHFFSSTAQYFIYDDLRQSPDSQLAAIAEKSLKEVTYHFRWSAEWVIRLGDGTTESHCRMQQALEELWRYTAELVEPAWYEIALAENKIINSLDSWKNKWMDKVKEILDEATLQAPDMEDEKLMQSRGKTGMHTEHLGYILAEMQFLQRAYPGNEW